MMITLLRWPPRRRSNRTGSRTAPSPFLTDAQWLLIADFFANPPASPQGGRPRVVVPRVSGRNPLDPNFWRPMERFTRTISLSRDLLEAAPRLDPQRRLPGRVGPSPRQARSVQADQLGGSDRRWLVFTGKKGGDEVGRTPKGNGTRILLMVDADGNAVVGLHDGGPSQRSQHDRDARQANAQLCYQTPRRLLYDKAADADWLRERLARRRHRTDLPPSSEPHQAVAAGWSRPPTLRPPLPGRTKHQLAALFPQAHHALGILFRPVPRVRPPGLLVHYHQPVMKLPHPKDPQVGSNSDHCVWQHSRDETCPLWG